MHQVEDCDIIEQVSCVGRHRPLLLEMPRRFVRISNKKKALVV